MKKKLTILLFLFIVLSMTAFGQEKSLRYLDLTPEQTRIGEEALVLLKKKEYKEAEFILTSALRSGDKVTFLELLGAVYYNQLDYINAEKYYQKALSLMTPEEEAFYTHNIRQQHAWTLEKLDRAEAIGELKKSLQNSITLGNATDFWYAANYFKKKNLPDDAAAAFLSVLLIDPTADEARAQLDSTRNFSYIHKQLPFNRLSGDQFAFFVQKVLPLGNPDNWSKKFNHEEPEAVMETLKSYVAFGDQATKNGLPTLSKDYRYWATRIIFLLAVYHNAIGDRKLQLGFKNGTESDFEQSLYFAGQFTQLDTIEAKPKIFQQGYYQILLDSYTNLHDLYHAVDAWKKLIKIDEDKAISDSTRKSDYKFATLILRDAFTNVSFDLKTGELRDWDFDDFSGHIVPNKNSTNKSLYNKNIPGHKYKWLIDCNCYPYGITSSSEDWANTGTEQMEAGMVSRAFSKKTHADTMNVVAHQYFFTNDRKETLKRQMQLLEEYKTDRYAKRTKFFLDLIAENNFEQPLKELIFRAESYYDLKYSDFKNTDPDYQKTKEDIYQAIYQNLNAEIAKHKLDKPNLRESYYVLKALSPIQ